MLTLFTHPYVSTISERKYTWPKPSQWNSIRGLVLKLLGKRYCLYLTWSLKNISLEFLGATRWRDSPENKAKMREREIKGRRVGWECCLDITCILGASQTWTFQLCKTTNSFCSGHFEMGFPALATDSILIYPLFLLTFLLSSTSCLVYIVSFVLVH